MNDDDEDDEMFVCVCVCALDFVMLKNNIAEKVNHNDQIIWDVCDSVPSLSLFLEVIKNLI